MEITVADNVELLWTFILLVFVYGFGLKNQWLNLKSMIILSLTFGFYHIFKGLLVGWGYYDLSIVLTHLILAFFFIDYYEKKSPKNIFSLNTLKCRVQRFLREPGILSMNIDQNYSLGKLTVGHE